MVSLCEVTGELFAAHLAMASHEESKVTERDRIESEPKLLYFANRQFSCSIIPKSNQGVLCSHIHPFPTRP